MHINIKATHIPLTDAIRDYATKRVEALSKYVDPNDSSIVIDVEVAKTTEHHHSGDIFYAEINFRHGGILHRAEARTADLYAAIDEAQEEMARIIRKSKEKDRDMFRRGSAAMKDLLRGFGEGVGRMGRKFRNPFKKK